MPYRLTLPGKTVIGENALELAEKDFRALGKKALVVTGSHVAKTGAMRQLTGFMSRWGIAYEVFEGIAGEPTDEMVLSGVAAYRAGRCDFIVGLGGGSPLDSAKAIAAMVSLPGKPADYMGRDIEGAFPPVALLPTTAGTGSEATKFSVITDAALGVKMLLRGEALLPTLAVVDPAFTLTAPPSVTAATGMDALTHAAEAYTSRMANPFTDMLALDAIRRIFESLPAAYQNGANLAARAELSLAAYEAGVCINNSSVTLVHGMSRPIGALFHVPHGLSNAILIAPCFRFAADGCYPRFAAITRAIGTAAPGAADHEASESFLTALERLCGALQVPTLAQYGVDQQAFQRQQDKMAGDALASGSPANTVKEVTKNDLLNIYSSLW